MNDRKNLWVWVGVAVVVLVVVIGIITWFVHRGQKPQLGPVPMHAPEGQVVAGFPQDLVMGAKTASSGAESFFSGITNSYSIGYSSSTNQYTAEWTSSSTPAALYAKYQDYMTKNGWTVTNHADTTALKGIYATNASSSVISVVIVPLVPATQSKGSKVTATYTNTVQSVGQ